MARHFLGLYVLIIVTLAVVSWGQDRLLQAYSTPDTAEEKPLAAALTLLADRLHEVPSDNWRAVKAGLAAETGMDLEVFASGDIAGRDTLERLGRGELAYMRSAAGDSWVLKRLDSDHVLALRSAQPAAQRGPLEWGLTIAFYALIALVLMIWIWPLSRDLRALEKSAAQYGNRNWRFAAQIGPRSQIYPLAETFRRMAARIDGLIASHQDMSNAVSHEIKTPLSRMRFEIELAQQAATLSEVRSSLSNIKSDIASIDGLVKATLSYAILERADVTLKLAPHDLASLIPGLAAAVRHDAPPNIAIAAEVQPGATQVVCDVHLFETILRNLLYNATRFAASRVCVTFTCDAAMNRLLVDDDGPGIPEQERSRVFQSFVQLEAPAGKKVGYGLGLAIVKRAVEWHGGAVSISDSPLGGTRVCVSWPVPRQPATA
jgi:two-component system OmpR family sensor kinase